MELNSRKAFIPRKKPPLRRVRPAVSKIIFLSLEGCVTEEEYFRDIVMEYFSNVKSKIQFVSVQEDVLKIPQKWRTQEQESSLGRSLPDQLVEKIDVFKQEHNDRFEFDKFPDDEFWVVMDVDDHWSDEKISHWNNAVAQCREKGYSYAVSNPFFELWLLLHHDDVTTDEEKYAVTSNHSYEKTSHFKERLAKLGAPIRRNKHLDVRHYSKEKIIHAVSRAVGLHKDRSDLSPKYLATTVYLLLEEIIDLDKNVENL